MHFASICTTQEIVLFTHLPETNTSKTFNESLFVVATSVRFCYCYCCRCLAWYCLLASVDESGVPLLLPVLTCTLSRAGGLGMVWSAVWMCGP